MFESFRNVLHSKEDLLSTWIEGQLVGSSFSMSKEFNLTDCDISASNICDVYMEIMRLIHPPEIMMDIEKKAGILYISIAVISEDSPRLTNECHQLALTIENLLH